MRRRSLIQGIGLLGLGVAARRWLGSPAEETGSVCWLTPEETEGPYYFDPGLIRRDITEGKTGVPLALAIGVVDASCRAVPNLLVDVWHADKDGLYSGYAQPGGNTQGQTFLRGTQPTDTAGVARFDTIYPGWYQGRATHIHFKVRIPDATYVTSQFAFDDAINDSVYATSLYAGRGPNPTSNAEDNIFGAAHPKYLEVALVGNTNGYDGTFAIGLAADLAIFVDGFESGDLSMWTSVIGTAIGGGQ